MEKVLVKFDEFAFNQLQENVKASRQYVQEFIDDLNSINELKITVTHLQDLLLGDGQKTLQAIVAETLKQIEKSGIKSKNV